MISHVISRAKQTSASKIVVATDSREIKLVAEKSGVDVMITSGRHPSGSDRIHEAIIKMSAKQEQLVINLQGDEPLINPRLVEDLAILKSQNPDVSVATVATPLDSRIEISNPNCVKVVLDKNSLALYFSRSSIPWSIDSDITTNYFRHIGIYAFNSGCLGQFIKEKPCDIEKTEKLEQLRWLWMGRKIKVLIEKNYAGIGVDTEEDLAKVRKLLKKSNN